MENQSTSSPKLSDGKAQDEHENLVPMLMPKDVEKVKGVQGFPLGEFSAIQAMSLPPYYTACPNPFLPGILADWQAQRNQDGDLAEFHRQPFAADIAEGKQDPIYKVHSYHTKVPPRAILRYIIHYTRPGDIVLDAFCGTGMTGVAAQMCGTDNPTLKAEIETEWNQRKAGAPEWGTRRAVLCDLSPLATTIAANHNLPVGANPFRQTAAEIIQQCQAATKHFYNAKDDQKLFHYGVWSQVFTCPECSAQFNFMEQAFDVEKREVQDLFSCPSCNSQLEKQALDRTFESEYDPIREGLHQHLKYQLHLVARSERQRSKIGPASETDKRLAEECQGLSLPTNIPVFRLPLEKMYHGSRLGPKGVEYIHDLFLRRQLITVADLWGRTATIQDNRLRSALRFLVDQSIASSTILTRYPQLSPLGGVYYIPSMVAETRPLHIVENKLDNLTAFFSSGISRAGQVIISTNSATEIPGLGDNSIDYIFTDPPFGENIFYADLNLMVEAWYGVFTASDSEIIVDKPKNKDLKTYQKMMYQAFQEYHRVLKPGRWMTVVFHNSNNAVWNAIQQAMLQAGFIVADVRMLDKQQKSYRQVTSSAVKQDLVISAYKPVDLLEEKLQLSASNPESVWDFLAEHLKFLPVFLSNAGEVEVIRERQPNILYDRMIAAHVQRGLNIPIGFGDFLQGLYTRFLERDGMFFLVEQAVIYDQGRLQSDKVQELIEHVADERSAIQWLRHELDDKLGSGPQTYQEIQPKFLKALHQNKFDQVPELRTLLKDNFVDDDLDKWHLPNPERQADLEALRQRILLREFNNYARSKGQLKTFRIEAIRAGFRNAWQEQAYELIVSTAERLPESFIQEDQQLLMYYHNATLRRAAKPRQERLL